MTTKESKPPRPKYCAECYPDWQTAYDKTRAAAVHLSLTLHYCHKCPGVRIEYGSANA